MRTAAAVLMVLLSSAVASADVAGVYDVKFQEQSTNCTSPLRYPNGKLTIKLKGSQLSVDIDRTPLMYGVRSKTGAIHAKSKSGGTMIEGMKGVFSVAGKVTPEGMLHLVMIGEYTANGRPLCTQSWDVIGPRVAAKPPAKPRKRSAADVDRGEDRPVMADLVDLARIGR